MSPLKYQIVTLLLIFSLFVPSRVLGVEDKEIVSEKIIREKARVETLKRELKKEKEKLKRVKKKERRVLSELDSIERALIEKQRTLKVTKERLALVKGNIQQINSQIYVLNHDIQDQEETLKRRLVALYKFGGKGYLNVLFSAKSYFDMLNRYKYMGLILDQDIQLIQDYQRNLALLNKRKRRLAEEKRSLSQLKKNVERDQERIKANLKKKNNLLSAIQNRKDLFKRAIKEYEEASRALQSLIESLQEKARKAAKKDSYAVKGGSDFGGVKGALPFPVQGRVLRPFGIHRHPTLNTFVFHNGIDIEASYGEEIRSIFDGDVIFAGWLKGYGNTIILDHGNSYYSLAAHASKLLKKVGEPVEAGEPVALVGDTASLKGPYLYFEIRYHGKPVDPLKWLASPSAKHGLTTFNR